MQWLVICTDWMKIKWLLEKLHNYYPQSLVSIKNSTLIMNDTIYKFITKGEFEEHMGDYADKRILTESAFVREFDVLYDFFMGGE